jgi:hypothetical protein
VSNELHSASVQAACEKHWGPNRGECNKFVQAVADELLVLIPGATSQADLMVWLMKDWLTLSGSFVIPRGAHAAHEAIQFANSGSKYFVIAGMTSADINLAHNWHPPLKGEEHGHVAVVTTGHGTNGWPRGYWGKHGGVGQKDASLSLAFPHRHPELIYYFCTSLSDRPLELKRVMHL